MSEFSKHEVIFSESMGVCEVSDIINLSVNKKPPIQYYVITPIQSSKSPSYIPVEGHQVMLRHLVTTEEAKNKMNAEEINDMERAEIDYVMEKSGK